MEMALAALVVVSLVMTSLGFLMARMLSMQIQMPDLTMRLLRVLFLDYRTQ